jgi:Fe-S-cluster containining protein
LKDILPAGIAAATAARVENLKQEREKLRGEAWAARRLPCALLKEGRCSVYPVRPLTCRGFNSADAAACQDHVISRYPGKVPVYEPQLNIATYALDGTRAGLAEVGLKSDLLELNAALEIALRDANAESDWLAGKPAFASARLG